MIQWDDKEYSVGITKFDHQHRQLVALINALVAKKGEANKELIEKILNTLVVYTRTHFQDEERFLKKVKYPGIDRQVNQHEAFISKINEYKQIFHEGSDTEKISLHISKYLAEWLTYHIQVEDREYAAYLGTDPR